MNIEIRDRKSEIREPGVRRMRPFAYALLLANIAAHLGGDVPASRPAPIITADASISEYARQLDSATEYVKRFNVKNVNNDTLNTQMKSATASLVQEYARKEYGLSPEKLAALKSGQVVMTKNMEGESLSAAQIAAELEATAKDLTEEELRDLRATMISFEAKGMQQYLSEFHKQQTKSFKESLDLQLKNLKAQLENVMDYYRKFPAVAISCT